MNSPPCAKKFSTFCAMIDAHLHVTEELLPYVQDILCIPNADNPVEYVFLHQQGFPYISAGIHPWKADCTDWEEMEPILRTVPVIGEIGLDNVWCKVDPDIQRQVFHRQLALAAQLRKPVILHTKGMEQEVLETIRSYPNRYLVHWYACEEHLQEYIDFGCWFTVGPDVRLNPAVETAARTVPLDRLLIESDGLDGIAWGQGTTRSPTDYPQAMTRHLQTVAKLRNMDAAALLQQMERNFRTFLQQPQVALQDAGTMLY